VLEPARSLILRCDASPEIGSGHVTRCLSLAAALREVAVEPVFAMRDEPATARVRAAGFHVVRLRPGAGALDQADLDETVAAAHAAGAAGILVDHYGADGRYLEGIARAGLVVAAIDDHAAGDFGAANWLLNQNILARDLHYDVATGCELLLGLGYALLRPGFRSARASLRRRFATTDRRLLVTLGGGDTGRLCAAALDALDRLPVELEIRCVLGFDARDASAAEEAAARSRHTVDVLRGVEDMAALMASTDLSVNAGGSTCWELLCLGVPMIVAGLSSDQQNNPRGLVEAGLAERFDPAGLADLPALVEALFADPGRRTEMSRRGRALVDGEGAARAAASLAAHLAARVEVSRAAG
jgi:UDP-2,4-diacetamido-2,4,6-trideoxy-beta-L-altropyranose hydrolase